MRDLVIYHGAQTIEKINQAKQMPENMQRLMFFNQKIDREFGVGKSYWKDGDFVYVVEKHKVMLSSKGKLFTTSSYIRGLTYKPGNKHELILWRNTKLSEIDTNILNIMLIHAGAEWACSNLYDVMLRNTGLFKRVLKGRITNGADLVRAYLRVSPLFKDMKISHRANTFLTLLKNAYDVHSMSYFLRIVKNPESCLDKMLNGARLGSRDVKNPETGMYEIEGDFGFYELPSHIQGDMRRELMILDKKIDHAWSKSRLMDEHTAMSRELMQLELDMMETIDYSYSQPCPLAPGMELISDNRRLFTEGTVMDHCIYSYLNRALKREVFHLHCTIGEFPFSVAIQPFVRMENKVLMTTFKIQQMFGKRNKQCSEAQRMIIQHWLSEPTVQAWFEHEHNMLAVAREEDTLPF